MPARRAGSKIPVQGLPTVSAVVPTYNEEKLVGRTLGNLRKLLGPKAQIIVADGKSKDNTIKIARKYARVVFEHDHTVGGGRNAGAAVAKGEIVWFVDADTFPTREFLNRMLIAFKDPNVVGVGCQVMPENLGFERKIFFRALNMMIRATVISGYPTIAGSCIAYRLSAFRKVGGFNVHTNSSEDFELCLKISRLGKVVFLNEITAPTSDRRVRQLGVWGLVKDWTHSTVMFLSGRNTRSYYAPR
jgi:cellulose synthase/poly-beta-1,6-N-acetylglucosamine synthase-like glycosyltransferase